MCSFCFHFDPCFFLAALMVLNYIYDVGNYIYDVGYNYIIL